MASKIILLLFFCLTSFEITKCRNIEDKSILGELVKTAKALIQKLQDVIGGMVNSALNILKDLEDRITAAAKDAISQGIKQIQNIINKALDTVSGIIKKAEETGLDVKSCLDLVNKLQHLPEKLIIDEINCVTKEAQQATKIVNDTINTVTNIYEQVTKFPGRLQNCLKDPLPAIKCVAGVIADMLKLEATAPVEIDKEIRDALEFVTGFEVRVRQCAMDQVTNATTESMKIIDDMKECVANLTTKAY